MFRALPSNVSVDVKTIRSSMSARATYQSIAERLKDALHLAIQDVFNARSKDGANNGKIKKVEKARATEERRSKKRDRDMEVRMEERKKKRVYYEMGQVGGQGLA